MTISRRDILKLSLVPFVPNVLIAKDTKEIKNIKEYKTRIVVVGGGFGGLTIAKKLKLLQKDIEIIVLDKNELFMTGPMYNLILGDIKNVTFNTILHDRKKAASKYGYKLIKTEVVDINRDKKQVVTTNGTINYTYLVLSPGIAYNYEKQFPKWDKQKIQRAKIEAPAALIPSDEFLILYEQLKLLKSGQDIVLSVPVGKYRCPPAPYERACMFANYIRKNNLKSKVIVIDNYSRPVSKTEAFEEAYKEVYSDIIKYYGDSMIEDVDFDKKKVIFSYWGEGSSDDGDMITLDYGLLNIMVNNKASDVIKMAKIKTTSWGSAVMKAPSYQSIDDDDIYIIGDCVSYPYPESGQMANAMGNLCAKHISNRIDKILFDNTKELPNNMCISMIEDNPDSAVYDTHSISYKNKKFKVSPYLYHNDIINKYRDEATAEMLFSWYDTIISDML